MKRPYYLVTRVYGPFSIPLAIGVTLLLNRGELFYPLLLVGLGLIVLSLMWDGLKAKKQPVYVAASKYLHPSINLLSVSVIAGLFTAGLGATLQTGFSPLYAVLLLTETALLGAGSILSILGILRARRRLQHDREKAASSVGERPTA